MLSAASSPAQEFREIKLGLVAKTPILTFHDIIAERDAKALWFDCTEAEFREQLDWLTRRGANFVSLAQVYDHLVSGTKLPPHAIALTFADGYLGFYQRAFPILQARHIPAAMFVHTGFVGSPLGRPKMSWDQLRELDRTGVKVLSQTASHPLDLRMLTNAQLAKEMSTSRAMLEKRLGHPVRAIAYPNGKWDQRASSILAVPRYVHTRYRQAWRDAYGG